MRFTEEPWVILSKIEQSIKEKIEKYGVPLKDWDIDINYGIKTGCNEAFIIDEAKRAELIQKDPKSAEIIRPILRGKDIRRYGYEFKNIYIIIAKFGSYKELPTKYPAIYEHLKQYEEVLRNRGQCRYKSNGKPDLSPDAPYPGQHHWLELDNNPRQDYLDDFSKPKICYSETNSSKATKITFDTNGYYTDKTCFILLAENNILKHIYNILSSEIFTWYMYNTSPLLGDEGISLTKDSVLRFPLCQVNSSYCLTEEEINCISESLK